MIFKGFCIGIVCLCLGGVIGYNLVYYEARVIGNSTLTGIEMGKKSVLQKK